MHIDGPNVSPARDIDEATARELLAEAYDRRAMRAEVGGWHKIAADYRARAAEIRKGRPHE